MDLGLAGKRVVITGASRGIGRACADAFAREGAVLHLVARSADALAAAKTELTASGRRQVSVQVMDVTAPGAADAELRRVQTPISSSTMPAASVAEISCSLMKRAGGKPGSSRSSDINMSRAFYRAMCERHGQSI